MVEDAIAAAIRRHPQVVAAAMTGSRARGEADGLSDLDVLVVASDVEAVADVRSWLPHPERVLLVASHLQRYVTVLFEDEGCAKLDMALYSANEPEASWIVGDYRLVKGDATFESRLAAAARATRDRAAHLSSDASVDNVLLLLVTASQRVRRGELASAHAWLALAWDLELALETRMRGLDAAADPLDPRRRLEVRDPPLARSVSESLYCEPGAGVLSLARHLVATHLSALSEAQRRVLATLGAR